MKFQINAIAALLASTLAASSVSAARLGLGLKPHEGDHPKKATDEELLFGRKLDVNASEVETEVDVENVNASSIEDAAFMPGGGGGKNKKDRKCHVGLEWINLENKKKARCCNMPALYWLRLGSSFTFDVSGNVEQAPGCSIVRPECYETGLQISLFQLQSKFGYDGGWSNYNVCKGTVIRPAPLAPGPDLDPRVFTGELDSPVIVSIKDLELRCPSGECTFEGGDYHILSLGELPFPDPSSPTIVEDTSGLLVEGFTFTGVMTSLQAELKLKFSCFLGAKGKGMIIRNNKFVDIEIHVVDGENCITQGYTAIYVAPSEVVSAVNNPGILDMEVTIEDNEFKNINTGTFPVYTPENPKECNFCFKKTDEVFSITPLIGNIGQEVNIKGNTFESIVCGEIYRAISTDRFYEVSPQDDKFICDPNKVGEPCFNGTMADNTFKDNHVMGLVSFNDPTGGASIVSITNNEGVCDNTYTGSQYCPLRVYNNDNFVGELISFDPLMNCDGAKFCFSEQKIAKFERTGPNFDACRELNE